MKTLVTPVDFSQITERVVSTAGELARALGGRVLLLHVVVPPQAVEAYGVPLETAKEPLKAEINRSEAELASLRETLTARGIEAETACLTGHTVETVLEKTRAVEGHLIVVGSHGHGRLYNLLVGSTASGLLKGATCPVVVVPPVKKN
jgi:nucleotide-binding universal stress UspA family protein